ncbi:predicted protein [Nematostella vectensis]|uniref:Uncharacterized protein n=1 Tax=Nematostella vectensis TaxID=45351 RepID=A7S3X6_NEMVE|nr:predicted protein [Nematostella vectensis]|eukprot:XP_001633626.1 predicted protein [Nematostella vectensis]
MAKHANVAEEGLLQIRLKAIEKEERVALRELKREKTKLENELHRQEEEYFNLQRVFSDDTLLSVSDSFKRHIPPGPPPTKARIPRRRLQYLLDLLRAMPSEEDARVRRRHLRHIGGGSFDSKSSEDFSKTSQNLQSHYCLDPQKGNRIKSAPPTQLRRQQAALEAQNHLISEASRNDVQIDVHLSPDIPQTKKFENMKERFKAKETIAPLTAPHRSFGKRIVEEAWNSDKEDEALGQTKQSDSWAKGNDHVLIGSPVKERHVMAKQGVSRDKKTRRASSAIENEHARRNKYGHQKARAKSAMGERNSRGDYEDRKGNDARSGINTGCTFSPRYYSETENQFRTDKLDLWGTQVQCTAHYHTAANDREVLGPRK